MSQQLINGPPSDDNVPSLFEGQGLPPISVPQIVQPPPENLQPATGYPPNFEAVLEYIQQKIDKDKLKEKERLLLEKQVALEKEKELLQKAKEKFELKRRKTEEDHQQRLDMMEEKNKTNASLVEQKKQLSENNRKELDSIKKEKSELKRIKKELVAKFTNVYKISRKFLKENPLSSEEEEEEEEGEDEEEDKGAEKEKKEREDDKPKETKEDEEASQEKPEKEPAQDKNKNPPPNVHIDLSADDPATPQKKPTTRPQRATPEDSDTSWTVTQDFFDKFSEVLHDERTNVMQFQIPKIYQGQKYTEETHQLLRRLIRLTRDQNLPVKLTVSRTKYKILLPALKSGWPDQQTNAFRLDDFVHILETCDPEQLMAQFSGKKKH